MKLMTKMLFVLIFIITYSMASSVSVIDPMLYETYLQQCDLAERYNDSYRFYEDSLTDDEIDLYNKILRLMDYQISDRTLLFQDQKDVETLTLLACLDDPLFSITNSYYSITADELYFMGLIEYAVLPITFEDPEFYEKMTAAYHCAQEIVSTIPEDFDEYETIKYLHDYIVTTVRYDEDETNNDANNAYGALIQHQARCEGYTNAYMLLLDLAGIKNTKVFYFGTDTGDSYGHIWNLVKIGDQYYHVDTTNDSLISKTDTKTNYVSYTYFMISTEDILKISTINEMIQPFIPACDDVSNNFYYKNGLYFTEYDRSAIGKASGEFLKQQLDNGLNGVSIKFENYNDLQTALRSTELRYLLNAINKYDGSNADYYRYIVSEDQMVITFFAQE